MKNPEDFLVTLRRGTIRANNRRDLDEPLLTWPGVIPPAGPPPRRIGADRLRLVTNPEETTMWGSNPLHTAVPKPKKDLRGVNGWLLFFVALTCGLSPLRNVETLSRAVKQAEAANTALAANPVWHTYTLILWSGVGMQAVLFWGLGWLLLTSVRRNALRWSIRLLWAGVLFVPLWTAGAVAYLVGGSASVTQATQSFLEMIGGSILATIWTVYLLRSRRVKNTYADPPVIPTKSET